MDGAIVGLNLADCLARPSAAEPEGEALEYLLLAGEAGALTAMRRTERDR